MRISDWSSDVCSSDLVESHLADGLPAVEADAGQLENAVLNIALNARDAMDGEGRLTITTALQVIYEPRPSGDRTVPPGSYVTIGIRDTGTGMPADVKVRIFEPFFTTKDIGKGSGLGLSRSEGRVGKECVRTCRLRWWR